MSRNVQRLCTVILFAGLVLLLLLWWRSGNVHEATAPPVLATSTPVAIYTVLNQAGPHWLPNVDLRQGALYGAPLQGANLRGANLSSATLAHADLRGANLMLANLQRAELLAAQLDGADLALANLTNARLASTTLTDANLEGADLKGAKLTGAHLDRANLMLADLRGASLRFASLRGANLTTVDFRHADLQGADLMGAVLNNANLEAVNLQGVVLTDIISDAHTIWPANFRPEQPNAPVALSSATSDLPTETLPIEMSLIPPLIAFFNQMGQPADTARIDHVRDLTLLSAVHMGQRMAVFKSATLSEALVPRIADQFDILGYNLEHGPTNPIDEQAAPVAAVQRMRLLADRYGLPLALGLDHEFARSHGASLAPFADRFVLQLQRVQDQPALARAFVISMSNTLRHVNPSVMINVQVAATGDVAEVATLLQTLHEYIDGVSILTDQRALDKVRSLWDRLRTPPPEQERPAPLAVHTPSWTQQTSSLFLGLMLQAAVLLGLWAICAG